MAAPAFAECTVDVGAVADPPGWRLQLSAPCHPYTPVTVRYGPLTIPETTGGRGAVGLRLPVLGPDTEAVVAGEGLLGRATPPPGSWPTGFLWVEPGAAGQPGVLDPVGFAPAPGAPLPELRVYPAGETPAHIDLPVTPSNCGGTAAFGLMRDGWEAPRSVTVTLPACDADPVALRLPVPER